MRLPLTRTDAAGQAGEATAPGDDTTPLHRFNTAPVATVERALLECCGSPRWAHTLAAHRPYPNVRALLAAADEASYDMTHVDLAEALALESAQHPLVEGPAALAAHTAMRAAHAAYETRFGYAFVIHLDGYRPDERPDQALAGIRARLTHEVDHERGVAAEELRRIARDRLAHLVTARAPGAEGP